MLSRLNGILIEKQPPYVLLDVQGVGYEIQMPMICFYQLPEIGQPAVILTHFWVREEAQLLYGFCSQAARVLFRALVKVNGVGPKLALAILSGLSASQFIQAVEQDDISVLIKLPGVGKKTAERLLVEMRDRCQKLESDALLATQFTTKNSSTDNLLFKQSAQQEAVAALIALGYKPSQASHMIQQVAQSHTEPVECETLIRQALRQL